MTTTPIIRACVVGFIAAVCGLARAEVKLPAVIASDMVLQRERLVPIWGTADPGEAVRVAFAGQTKSTTAAADGKWRVDLDPLATSAEPAGMTIAGSNTIELTNILVGEVWLCSGQSNMDWKLPEAADGAAATAAADHPQIRLFFVPRRMRPAGNNLDGSLWRVCKPESARMFSAVAYYFGRDLQQNLNVPIGLIHTSWGGSPAEAWVPESYLAASDDLRPCLEKSKQMLAERPEAQKRFDADMAKWREESARAKSQGTPEPPRPAQPDPLRPQLISTSLWTGMLEPAVPFAIRGALWYQGESNEDRAQQYRILLPTLIKAWRDKWGQGDLPFGIIQLPNYKPASSTPQDNTWSHLRDSQDFVHRNVPHTGLITTIDLGEGNNIHPRNKLDVGKRAARWALAEVYGQKLVIGGPVYKDSRIEGNKVIVRFEQVGEGLKVRSGDALHEFVIAGEDKVWHWAEATISSSDAIEVSSSAVTSPKAVRYAWNDNPKEPNLTNETNIPAGPFRTDAWPGPTDGKR